MLTHSLTGSSLPESLSLSQTRTRILSPARARALAGGPGKRRTEHDSETRTAGVMVTVFTLPVMCVFITAGPSTLYLKSQIELYTLCPVRSFRKSECFSQGDGIPGGHYQSRADSRQQHCLPIEPMARRCKCGITIDGDLSCEPITLGTCGEGTITSPSLLQ
jgi:hypothetical protein